MKKQLAIILFLLPVYNLFSSNVISLPYITSDIVYSTQHDKLYALIDGIDTEYGNRLVEMNPRTGAVERTLFIGSQPWRIRLTTDENYAWISFISIPYVKRINLNSFEIDKKIYLGPVKQYVPNRERNSQVFCYTHALFHNENNKLVMGLKTDFVFDYQGIVLYDNDTILPKRFFPLLNPDYMPSSIETALNDSYVIGHYYPSNKSVFTTLEVVDSGLLFKDQFHGLVQNEGWYKHNNIQNHNDTLFVSDGTIVDATNISNLHTIGKCKHADINDRYGFVFSNIHNSFIYPTIHNNIIALNFYNKETFKPYDSVNIMEYHFIERMLISSLEVMDENHFAILIAKDGGLFTLRIIDTRETGTDEHSYSQTGNIFPNPASEKIYVKTVSSNNTLYMYDIVGRLMCQWNIEGLSAEITLKNKQPGMYVFKLTDNDNNSSTTIKKIILQ